METAPVSWWDALLLKPVQSLLTELLTFLPRLLGAILVLLIGWWIARGIEAIVVRILRAIAFDKLVDQIQLSDVLEKGGIRRKFSELLAAIVYWIVMLAVVMVAFNVLQLTVAAQLFQNVVAFLPNVVAAVFILVIGVFAAAFLATTFRTAASNSGIQQAALLGQAVQIVVVIFSAVAALEQLQIRFVGEVFLIILGGISLGCALAFGLGCKDLAGKWIASIVEQVQVRKR